MRRPRFLPLLLSSFAVTTCVLYPLSGHAEPFEVVRVGDRAMTCQALAGEINALALANQTAAAEAPKPKKKGGFGFLKVLGSAVPFVGMGSAVGGALLSSASGAAQSMTAQSAVADTADDARRMAARAMTGPTPADQRKERLTGIFEEKHC